MLLQGRPFHGINHEAELPWQEDLASKSKATCWYGNYMCTCVHASERERHRVRVHARRVHKGK